MTTKEGLTKYIEGSALRDIVFVAIMFWVGSSTVALREGHVEVRAELRALRSEFEKEREQRKADLADLRLWLRRIDDKRTEPK